MKVEICEFYSNQSKGSLVGTLRVKLVDQGLDVLGVQVFFSNSRWFFRMPGRKAIHHETGEPVWYPLVSLSDPLLQKELISEIHRQAPDFIEKRFPSITKEVKADLISPSQVDKKQPQQEKACPTPTSAAAGKQMASKSMSEGWRDPPRKNKATQFHKRG